MNIYKEPALSITLIHMFKSSNNLNYIIFFFFFFYISLMLVCHFISCLKRILSLTHCDKKNFTIYTTIIRYSNFSLSGENSFIFNLTTVLSKCIKIWHFFFKCVGTDKIIILNTYCVNHYYIAHKNQLFTLIFL